MPNYDGWYKLLIFWRLRVPKDRQFTLKQMTYSAPLVIAMILLLDTTSCRKSTKIRDHVAVAAPITAQNPVPRHVRTYLNANFPGWNVADTADYTAGWWSFNDRTTVPFRAIADFNDDTLADYAFLLKKNGACKIVILLTQQHTFSHWAAPVAASSQERGKLHIGLTVEPPGRIDIARPAIRSLILPSNGVNLFDFEERTAVYYVNNGRIEMFVTR